MIHVVSPYSVGYGPWVAHGACLPTMNFTEINKEMTEAALKISEMYTSQSFALPSDTPNNVKGVDNPEKVVEVDEDDVLDKDEDELDEEDAIINNPYKLREALTAEGLQERFGLKHYFAMVADAFGRGMRNSAAKSLSKRRSSIINKVEKHADMDAASIFKLSGEEFYIYKRGLNDHNPSMVIKIYNLTDAKQEYNLLISKPFKADKPLFGIMKPKDTLTVTVKLARNTEKATLYRGFFAILDKIFRLSASASISALKDCLLCPMITTGRVTKLQDTKTNVPVLRTIPLVNNFNVSIDCSD